MRNSHRPASCATRMCAGIQAVTVFAASGTLFLAGVGMLDELFREWTGADVVLPWLLGWVGRPLFLGLLGLVCASVAFALRGRWARPRMEVSAVRARPDLAPSSRRQWMRSVSHSCAMSNAAVVAERDWTRGSQRAADLN